MNGKKSERREERKKKVDMNLRISSYYMQKEGNIDSNTLERMRKKYVSK